MEWGVAFIPMSVLIVWCAWGVDRLVGDPQGLPHPVVGMGKMISLTEECIRPVLRSKRHEKPVGAYCVVMLVILFFLVTFWTIRYVSTWNPVWGFVASVWITSTTIASKGLEQAAINVVRPLSQDALEEARSQVVHIVGRDTDRLDEQDVLRATIETVAENTIDAIIPPLFYAVIGGAPMAVAYRAINTLDSMWGHRNERYNHFGWAAAKLDDVANWLPARISKLLYPVAARVVGADGGRAWRTMKRDAHLHPSPNGGIPEAAVAGALGIQLGGWNTYGGRAEFRSYMGKAFKKPTTKDVIKTIRMMHAVTGIFLIVATMCVIVYRQMI